jgi:hypothetical protein
MKRTKARGEYSLARMTRIARIEGARAERGLTVTLFSVSREKKENLKTVDLVRKQKRI